MSSEGRSTESRRPRGGARNGANQGRDGAGPPPTRRNSQKGPGRQEFFTDSTNTSYIPSPSPARPVARPRQTVNTNTGGGRSFQAALKAAVGSIGTGAGSRENGSLRPTPRPQLHGRTQSLASAPPSTIASASTRKSPIQVSEFGSPTPQHQRPFSAQDAPSTPSPSRRASDVFPLVSPASYISESSEPPTGLLEIYRQIEEEELIADVGTDDESGSARTSPDRRRLKRISGSPSGLSTNIRAFSPRRQADELAEKEAEEVATGDRQTAPPAELLPAESPRAHLPEIQRKGPDVAAQQEAPSSGSSSSFEEVVPPTDPEMLARDERRVRELINSDVKAFSKASKGKANLTAANLSKQNAASNSTDGSHSSRSISSGRASEPSLHPPPGWGRKGSQNPRWMEKILEGNGGANVGTTDLVASGRDMNRGSEGASKSVSTWLQTAASTPLPDAPDSLESTPAAIAREVSHTPERQPFSKAREWESQNRERLLSPGKTSPAIAALRDRSMERLSKSAVATSRLTALGQTRSTEKLVQRSPDQSLTTTAASSEPARVRDSVEQILEEEEPDYKSSASRLTSGSQSRLTSIPSLPPTTASRHVRSQSPGTSPTRIPRALPRDMVRNSGSFFGAEIPGSDDHQSAGGAGRKHSMPPSYSTSTAAMSSRPGDRTQDRTSSFKSDGPSKIADPSRNQNERGYYEEVAQPSAVVRDPVDNDKLEHHGSATEDGDTEAEELLARVRAPAAIVAGEDGDDEVELPDAVRGPAAVVTAEQESDRSQARKAPLGDTHDLLRRFTRASSSSPAPSRTLPTHADDSNKDRSPDASEPAGGIAQNDQPVTSETAPAERNEESVPAQSEADDPADFVEVSKMDLLSEAPRPAGERLPVTDTPAIKVGGVYLKTPKVTGGWVDTPAPTSKQSDVVSQEYSTDEKADESTEPARDLEALAKTAPKLPRSPLAAIIEHAEKKNRGEESSEGEETLQLDDATIESLRELIAEGTEQAKPASTDEAKPSSRDKAKPASKDEPKPAPRAEESQAPKVQENQASKVEEKQAFKDEATRAGGTKAASSNDSTETKAATKNPIAKGISKVSELFALAAKGEDATNARLSELATLSAPTTDFTKTKKQATKPSAPQKDAAANNIAAHSSPKRSRPSLSIFVDDPSKTETKPKKGVAVLAPNEECDQAGEFHDFVWPCENCRRRAKSGVPTADDKIGVVQWKTIHVPRLWHWPTVQELQLRTGGRAADTKPSDAGIWLRLQTWIPRLTLLGWLVFGVGGYMLAEHMVTAAYTPPFYAETMVGYGVDAFAPRPPLVLTKLIWRSPLCAIFRALWYALCVTFGAVTDFLGLNTGALRQVGVALAEDQMVFREAWEPAVDVGVGQDEIWY